MGHRILGCILASAVCVAAAGCHKSSTAGPADPATPGASTPASDPRQPPPEQADSLGDPRVQQVVFLPQNWTIDETLEFYSLPHGSQLVPYSWFLHLEQPGKQELFRADANIRRLRFLPQKPNERYNKHGLPVGFAKDGNLDWVGLNCAACHTNQINFNGTGIRIDGAPAMADLDTFLRELTAALKETRSDTAKFDRFAAKVLGSRASLASEQDLLRQKLDAVIARREAYNKRNRVGNGTAERHPWGYGRIDAFGSILNQVTALRLQVPENALPADAPVSIPFIWDTPHHNKVQWNGAASNSQVLGLEFGSLGRNSGEVLGVFGELNIEKDLFDLWPGYPSSLRFANLKRSEDLLKTLWSPEWPEQLFEHPLKPDLVAKGRAVYERKKCNKCHAVNPREAAQANEQMVSIDEVGTDPRMAANFASHRSTGKLLKGRSKDFLPLSDRFGENETVPASELLAHVVMGAILHAPANEEQELPERSQIGLEVIETLKYKARPLNGIWATAPYLHNGSVPTLRHLLLPMDQRPAKFIVGHREFDPKSVGFTLIAEEAAMEEKAALGLFMFDTSLVGNRNTGHRYGAEAFTWGSETVPALTDDEREQLLEYLRSL